MNQFRDNAEPLIAMLHDSFDPMDIPPADEIMGSDWHDAIEFRDEIGSRHWKDVGESLNGAHQDAICLLSGVGLGYYLGSYMFASLLVRNNGYVFVDSTISILTRFQKPPLQPQYFDERATRLRRHTRVIIRFLEYFQDVMTGSDEEATFALESYWNQYR
jgi:hypothetical protein